jgi:hypothetical protein
MMHGAVESLLRVLLWLFGSIVAIGPIYQLASDQFTLGFATGFEHMYAHHYKEVVVFVLAVVGAAAGDAGYVLYRAQGRQTKQAAVFRHVGLILLVASVLLAIGVALNLGHYDNASGAVLSHKLPTAYMVAGVAMSFIAKILSEVPLHN